MHASLLIAWLSPSRKLKQIAATVGRLWGSGLMAPFDLAIGLHLSTSQMLQSRLPRLPWFAHLPPFLQASLGINIFSPFPPQLPGLTSLEIEVHPAHRSARSVRFIVLLREKKSRLARRNQCVPYDAIPSQFL